MRQFQKNLGEYWRCREIRNISHQILQHFVTILGFVFGIFALFSCVEFDCFVVCVVVARGRGDRFTQDVFRALDKREEALIAALTVRQVALPPNRAVVSEGEVGLGLFRLASGWAYRFRRSGGGCRQILDFLLPGEIIGLQAALLGVIEHSVRSLTPLQASVLDSRLVAEAFRTEPGLALRLARHVAGEASRVDELLTVVGCCDAVERLAYLMLSLYRRQARRGRIDPLDCPFPLRRQHMADALGLTGAHINRTLNRLRQEGIAQIENQRLVIWDLPRLGALAGIPDP
jgi:CRP-like cAMP-binding protein